MGWSYRPGARTLRAQRRRSRAQLVRSGQRTLSGSCRTRSRRGHLAGRIPRGPLGDGLRGPATQWPLASAVRPPAPSDALPDKQLTLAVDVRVPNAYHNRSVSVQRSRKNATLWMNDRDGSTDSRLADSNHTEPSSQDQQPNTTGPDSMRFHPTDIGYKLACASFVSQLYRSTQGTHRLSPIHLPVLRNSQTENPPAVGYGTKRVPPGSPLKHMRLVQGKGETDENMHDLEHGSPLHNGNVGTNL